MTVPCKILLTVPCQILITKVRVLDICNAVTATFSVSGLQKTCRPDSDALAARVTISPDPWSGFLQNHRT